MLDDRPGGVLVAVYSLIGKANGLPVCRLFLRNPKPQLVQTWWSRCFPPALMAAEVKRGQSLGYRIHKVKPFTMKDGFYDVLTKPGLVVSLDRNVIEKYRVA